MIRPAAPTAQTSLLAEPQTPFSPSVTPVATGAQPVVNRNAVPLLPTTHTLEELLAHTPKRLATVPVVVVVQLAPFQWRATPPQPTAQTSEVPPPPIA